MKTILITGGAGFIGSNFITHIGRTYPDYQIFVLDALTYAGNLNNIPGDIRKRDNFHFLHKDIKDRKAVEAALKKVDIVVHFAAETHVAYSLIKTDVFIDTNVKGTSILCESLIKSSVERLVYISSSEVYGTALTVPMDEDHPLQPRSPYAVSKLAADRLIFSFSLTYGLPMVILRPFNNYGPYQHVEKVIPRFLTDALRDRPLCIHDDGLQTRDWIYVNDTSEAIDLAIHAPLDKIRGETINIGTGVETDILTIARMILSNLGKPESLIMYGESRPGQVKRHVSSIEKARQCLGWKARESIEEGLKKTTQWYVNNHDWWQNVRHPEGYF